MNSLDGEKKCGCKGVRTCLVCEATKAVKAQDCQEGTQLKPVKERYIYCSLCEKAWPPDDSKHPHVEGHHIHFSGIFLMLDFITKEEEKSIVEEIDKTPWVPSQSGRHKQDYGPKVNFKRKKLKRGNFTGLPAFSRRIVEYLSKIPILENFKPVELCNLEYVPARGSSIDPHYDDFWLWGERLVTVNLLSSTYLSMTCDNQPGVEVAVPMPARSLIIVYGPARNEWQHGIHREDIVDRRLAVTLRELTPEFLECGEQADVGSNMLDIALTFNGTATS